MKQIKEANQFKPYINPKPNCAVLFVMETCPYCRAFRPQFALTAQEKPGKYEFVEMVLDDDSPLWEEYDIEIVPTIILFKQGKLVHRVDGKPGLGLKPADLSCIK